MKTLTTGLSPQCVTSPSMAQSVSQRSFPVKSTLYFKRQSMPLFRRSLASQESSRTLRGREVAAALVSQLPSTYISRQKTLNLERIHLDNEERMTKTLQSKLKMKEQRQATVQRSAYKEVLLTLKEIQDLKQPLRESSSSNFKPSFRVSLRLQQYSNEWRKNSEFYQRNGLSQAN